MQSVPKTLEQSSFGPAADEFRSLAAGFLASVAEVPERPALAFPDGELSYRQLYARASALAATVAARTPAGGPALTAVFASRSPTAYAGVLGSLLAGTGYVPLNRKFPADRTRVMLERAGCRAVIADEASAALLPEIVGELQEELLLILPDSEDVSELSARWPQHTVLGARELAAADAFEPRTAGPDDIAYLLFTSGSTGVPKGVGVAHRNVRHFLDVMSERYGFIEEDRLSQTFDLTFDLSVFDMFMAWESGACLCVLPDAAMLKPGRWMEEQRLTVWFSVPSLGLHMKRFGQLKAERYPTLRWSLFCGEGLPVELVESWSQAAPGSIVENLYGPTELTIACTLYRWDAERSPGESVVGLVPIGLPYPGMTVLVADDALAEVAPGAEGELLLTGPQVTPGYWHDPERTAAAFVVPPGKDEIYYRTGDLVRRPAGEGPITYLGRVDHQVKINGYRVELGEIEAAIRESGEVDEVVALGWPRTASGASAVTAFVAADAFDSDAVRALVSARLPEYMVPRTIHVLPAIPVNSNGKFDRPALVRLLEEGTA